MESVKEKRKLDEGQMDDLLDSFEEKALIKWYRRWRNEPWTYAVVKTLEKIPFYLLIVAVVSWEKIKPLFSDPFIYIKERIPLILVSFGLFTILFYFAWRSTALHYYLLSKTNERIHLRDGDAVSLFGSKASDRLPVQYRRWGQQQWLLPALLSLTLPVVFFSIFYLIHGFRESQWSADEFLAIFEDRTEVFVFAVFFFLGALLGYGISKEIRRNYQLLLNAKRSREQ